MKAADSMTEEKKDTGDDGGFRHTRNIMLVIVFLLLTEGIILISAVSQSGTKKILQITDGSSQVIYEINGEHLSEFDKYYFENTFGPLDRYEKKLAVREVPFPFRAWVTAAAGIPLFLILMSAFAVKAYRSLFVDPYRNGENTDDDGTDGSSCAGSGNNAGDSEIDDILSEKSFSSYMKIFEKMNIFVIGFIILLAVFLYWVIPNMMTYFSKTAIDFIINYKWFFIVVSVFAAGVILWIIYLKYLLAGKIIEAKKEIAIRQIEMSVNAVNALESGTKRLMDIKPLPVRKPDDNDYLADSHSVRRDGQDIPDVSE